MCCDFTPSSNPHTSTHTQRSARRPHRFNPVQLLESREFFYSETVFMCWLNLAITLASVAILLMGYSSMAYVNPLKRPTMHIAEIICLLMLPCSCIMVGYAIRSYVWRRRRLHSMRYRYEVGHEAVAGWYVLQAPTWPPRS